MDSKSAKMAQTFSIKAVPDDLATRLRQRASRNHRSLQGELLSILEAAVAEKSALTTIDVLARVAQLGVKTPSEAVAMQREDRGRR